MTDANTITKELGGRWLGTYGTAPCPVCQPEGRRDQNALTLGDAPDGRLLAHCKKAGCTFHDIAAALGLKSGAFIPPSSVTLAQQEAAQKAAAAKRARQARAVWREASPIGGTIGDVYLRGRGIGCALPGAVRFHSACWHVSGDRLPAMVALVEGSSFPAVHRTYLRSDGSGKAAVEPNKMMLGRVGGGAVRLTDSEGPLVVAEGLETALSLACGLLHRPAKIWAALSTAGMRGLRLPAQPGLLVVATDGDDAGRAAGHDLATRAHACGWRVSLLPAPDGLDWNDALMRKGAEHGR